MPLGFVLGTGPWEIRQFNTNSAATFLKGSLVELNGARDVVEYASTSSSVLGIAMHASVDSLPAGKVLVAIPKPGCTAICDVAPGVVGSVASVGQAQGIGKRGNYMSFLTDVNASVWSRIVTVVGPMDSASSRIEVAFTQNHAEIYSTSSVSLI